MSNTIFCVAGRSGGHIIPCLSQAEKLLVLEPELKLFFFSSNTQLDKALLKNHKSITKQILLPLSNVPGKNPLKWFLFCFQLIQTSFMSLYYLIKYRPKMIISTGGYVSIPLCLFASLLKIRVELFELNVVPGKAVTFLAPFVSVVKICFAETKNYLKKGRSLIAPYPLRAYDSTNKISQEMILKKLHFKKTHKTILVLGGSQGSQTLNELMLKALEWYPEKKQLQIIHQIGNNNPEQVKEGYNKINITAHIFKFDNHLEQFYPFADLVICRSGAGTLFETLYFKKQCITIPLETKNNSHQVDNARSFAKQYPDQFKMIQQAELQKDPSLLFKNL